MDPQQISQSRPHVFIFDHSIPSKVIISVTSLNNMPYFFTSDPFNMT